MLLFNDPIKESFGEISTISLLNIGSTENCSYLLVLKLDYADRIYYPAGLGRSFIPMVI